MSYNKTLWVNGKTVVSAENLNKIENELEELNIQLSNLGATSKQLTDVNLNDDSIVFIYSDGSTSTVVLEKDNNGLVNKFIKEDGTSININLNFTRFSN